jgi:hypothetical protein
MKMLHANIGEVEILAPDNHGHTLVRNKDGQSVLVTTLYLSPLPETNEPDRSNTGAGGGD